MSMDFATRINNRLAGGAIGASRSDCVAIAAEADAEIQRLTTNLRIANDQAKHFELAWLRRGDEIERLERERLQRENLTKQLRGRKPTKSEAADFGAPYYDEDEP